MEVLAGGGGTDDNVETSKLGGDVERCIAIVGEIWVLQILGVVLDDSFEEGQIVEMDCTPDTSGDVNPVAVSCLRLLMVLEAHILVKTGNFLQKAFPSKRVCCVGGFEVTVTVDYISYFKMCGGEGSFWGAGQSSSD